MTRHRLYYYEPKMVRDFLKDVEKQAERLHNAELELVRLLREVDERRFFIRHGYRSLRPYIEKCLKFLVTQAQRLVTEIRRSRDEKSTDQYIQSASNSGQDGDPSHLPDIEGRLYASEL